MKDILTFMLKHTETSYRDTSKKYFPLKENRVKGKGNL